MLTAEERQLPLTLRLKIDRWGYHRCGKCYACQCTTRAEWAFRAAVELSRLKFRGMTCFLTLTYDNKFLPTVLDDWDFFDIDNQRLLAKVKQRLISFQMSKRYLKRRWNFCRLERRHLSQFMEDLQKEYKKMRYDGEHFVKVERQYFDKSKNKVRTRRYWQPTKKYLDYFKYINLRFFNVGEYGTFTNRCHFHCLIFIPFAVQTADFERIVKKCWLYGHVDFDFDFGKGAINYVAKHQVKDDSGCEFQEKFFPGFKSVSKYQGGIGSDGINQKNFNRYLHVNCDGEYDKRYFEVEDAEFNKVFKVPMPKFYLDKFWKMYCSVNNIPEQRSPEQLDVLSRESEKKFKDFLVKYNIIDKFVAMYFNEPECVVQPAMSNFMQFVFDVGSEYTAKKRIEYKKMVKEKKRFKLQKKYNFKLKPDDLID